MNVALRRLCLCQAYSLQYSCEFLYLLSKVSNFLCLITVAW